MDKGSIEDIINIYTRINEEKTNKKDRVYTNIKLIIKLAVYLIGILGGGYYIGNIVLNSTLEVKTSLENVVSAVAEVNADLRSDANANANANSTATVNNVLLPGAGIAQISGEFVSAIQACWYYQATYKTLHPYTVLWERAKCNESNCTEEEKSSDFKIRVIADHGIWKAQKCIKEKADIDIKNLLDNKLKNLKDKMLKNPEELAENTNEDFENLNNIIHEINKNISKIGRLSKADHNDDINNEIRKLIHAKKEKNESKQRLQEITRESNLKDEIKLLVDNVEERDLLINKIKDSIDNEKKNDINELIEDVISLSSFKLNLVEIIKLIGEDSIIHRVEAAFKKDDFKKYIHIATIKAEYTSSLHFDNKGQITHRRVKLVSDYQCINDTDKIDPKNCEEKEAKDNGKNKNIARIIDIPVPGVNYKKETKEAIEFYIDQRKKLHQDLGESGCGAIPVEPKFVADNTHTGELENPSVIFLCHNDGKKSHVRVMARES